MQSLKTSNYISFYTANSEDFYLFNLARFKPIRLQGSTEEAKMLFNHLQQNNLAGLDKQAVSLLQEHFILVPRLESEVKPDDTKQTEWCKNEAETFTIRLETRISDQKAVLRALELAKDLFVREKGKYKFLNVKFICDSLLKTSLYELLLPLIQYVIANYPFETDNIFFYTDVPLSYVVKHTEKLRLFIVPNLRFNIYLDGNIHDQKIEALDNMVNYWGFMLNFVFQLNRGSIDKVPEAMKMLKSQWGSEFRYSLLVPLREPDESGPAYILNLPESEQIQNLLEFLLSNDAPKLDQNTLYQLLKKRLLTYPNCYSCRACAGKSLYINGKGQIGRCFWQCLRDPLSLKSALTESLEELICQKQHGHHFVCTSCSVRYFCGGECPLLSSNGSSISKHDEAAFSLRCKIRKIFINGILVDLTTPKDGQPEKGIFYKWKCQRDKIELATTHSQKQGGN